MRVNLLGIRALLVHALNEQAKAFYLGHGYITCASAAFVFQPAFVLLAAVISRSAARMTPFPLLSCNHKKAPNLHEMKRVILALINYFSKFSLNNGVQKIELHQKNSMAHQCSGPFADQSQIHLAPSNAVKRLRINFQRKTS